MFTNSEIGRSKHFPDIYDAAAQFMETEPEETWVCEDSLYALKTAANAGYRTVGVFDERGEPDQEGLRKTADLYIRDLRGLNDYFLNIK
jgi:FMN phosphatase YigB (HAD superfamily)